MSGETSRMMKQRVLRRIDDLSNNAFSDEEVYCWLSEAHRDVSTRCPDASLPPLCVTASWGPTTSYTHLIQAGVSAYDLPSDFLRERGLSYTHDGATVWAERIPHRELGLNDTILAAAANTKPRYWLWEGNINLEVGTVGASDSFVFYYVKHPPDYEVSVDTSGTESIIAESGAIDDSTDPTVSRHYWRAMEEFAVARCMEVRRNYEYANVCMSYYEKIISEIKARFVIPGDAADQYPSDGIATKTSNA